MENWITRLVAAICAAGSIALFWTFGMFLAVPWREGRMLSLDTIELQVVAVPLLVGLAVTWGTLHILAISDRETNPRVYAALRTLLVIASIAATFSGMSWSQARLPDSGGSKAPAENSPPAALTPSR
ncbi:MAG: hypothetical protein HY777_07945 [Betaproteobacteria bacterium]|nr:hypothetical protein [Betaproteobacteria bacterium]